MDKKRKLFNNLKEFLILAIFAILEGLCFYFLSTAYILLVTIILVSGIWLFFKFEKKRM